VSAVLRDLAGSVVLALLASASVQAAPLSVTIAGSFQSELGCAADWDPGCAVSNLTYDADDDVWQASWLLPAGSWEYKAALDAWAVNYGANAALNGANIAFALAVPTLVSFFYSDATHWATDDVGSVIAVAPGSFQSELGCAADWDPACLRSWLQDPDGDGTYAFQAQLPAGAYEAKVAIDQAWDENYGLGGAPNGPNIPFGVGPASPGTQFSYDAVTHILDIREVPEPASLLLVGSGVGAAVLRRISRRTAGGANTGLDYGSASSRSSARAKRS
jgi:hypothetical protein